MQDIDFDFINNYLKNHNSLIFPTETIYGIWCDARSDRAVQRLLDLTYRPQDKGIITLCSSLQMIEEYAYIRYDLERKIIQKFMPWPLTIILDSRHILSSLVEQPNSTIWVRIPNHPIALALIRHYGSWLVTKSANISGRLPPINFDMIDPYFTTQGIMMIDGWSCPLCIASTIVHVIDEHHFTILREGSITHEDIDSFINANW
jgi:L-threonylcarbamoyladenylate synthase